MVRPKILATLRSTTAMLAIFHHRSNTVHPFIALCKVGILYYWDPEQPGFQPYSNLGSSDQLEVGLLLLVVASQKITWLT